MNNPADFFVAGGNLSLRTESYVVRPADRELEAQVKAGEFCYVLTPRQMGKSSLMIRTAHNLRQAGWQVSQIDLTGIGAEQVTAEAWYQGLLARLRADLRLPVDIQTWWSERQALSVTDRFMTFLRDVALAETDQPLAIFIDEIDSTLKLEFSDDFFAAIRVMYNRRAEEAIYQRLTFILLGVATPSDLIKDQRRTPFNIGRAIDLKEFSRADAQVLAAGLDAAHPGQGEAILDRILHWTHGHPYLTQKLCLASAQLPESQAAEAHVDDLVDQTLLRDEARDDSNLRFVQSSIQAKPEVERRRLLQLYRRVYQGQTIQVDERVPEQNYLLLFGLVSQAKGRLQVRNEIYRCVFDLDWIEENIPSDREQKQAIWVIGGTVFLVLLALIYIFTRPDEPALRAEVCRQEFETATSKAVQMDALACLFELGPGYDEKARRLFYSLDPAAQKYLFLESPETIGAQTVEVVRGVYVTLDEMEGDHDHAIMEAMVQALENSNQDGIEALISEINAWMVGREHTSARRYDRAVSAYTEAITLNMNQNHPVVFYDRALAYVQLSRYGDALADLERTVVIAQSAPPTPTATPTKTPVSTLTLVVTSSPNPFNGPSSTPTTLTGSQTPVDLKDSKTLTGTNPAPEVNTPPVAIQVLRFINTDRVIDTVGELISQTKELDSYLVKNQDSYPKLVMLYAPTLATAIAQLEVTPATRPTIRVTPDILAAENPTRLTPFSFVPTIESVVRRYSEEIKVESSSHLDGTKLEEVLIDPVLERQKRSTCWLQNEGMYYTYSNHSLSIESIVLEDDRHATVLGRIQENRILRRKNGAIFKDYGFDDYRFIYQLEKQEDNKWYIYCMQPLVDNELPSCRVILEDGNPCE